MTLSCQQVFSEAVMRHVFFVSATLAAWCFGLAQAWADCPSAPASEEGGIHTCFDAGPQGHVHLWMPGAFEAATAQTVVYIHGYNLDGDDRQVGDEGLGADGCANQDYVDCAWERHHLARQFAESGLNALFVAVAGPTGDPGEPLWESLDDLLDGIGERIGTAPNCDVTVVAHSGGIFTGLAFLDSPCVRHLIALDAVYRRALRPLPEWFRASFAHRLTLIGAEGVSYATARMGKRLGCLRLAGPAEPYSRPALRARCAVAIDRRLRHMDVVLGRQVIPRALLRFEAPSVVKAGTTAGRK